MTKAVLEGPVCGEQFGAFWLTRAPIEYRDDRYRRLVVPEGFVHDFASTPRLLWPIFPPTDYCYARAGIVHDYAYASHLVDRRTADAMLYLAARACGTGRLRAGLMWLAVRIGGGSAYRSGPRRQTANRRRFEATLKDAV